MSFEPLGTNGGRRIRVTPNGKIQAMASFMFSQLPVGYQNYYPAADYGLRFPQDENNEGAQVCSVTNGKTDTIKSNASPEPAVAELHPDLDNQESIASVDEQGNEGREENEGREGFEAERDKCQL